MRDNRSGTSWRSWPKDEFTDLVFSWSLREIFDENLYKHQVAKIPESFESVDQYLTSYVFPLLEETRAELASAMETAYKAPFAEVSEVSFIEFKQDTLFYDVKVDEWKNRTSDRGKEIYRTLPGDFVLLSDSKPESASDLQRAGWTYTFASVKQIYEDESDDNCSSSVFKLKTADENDDNCTSSVFKLKTAHSIEAGDRQRKPLYVVYLMNMTTHRRIWNALRMRQNLKIIGKILSKNDLDEKICEFCPLKCHSEVEEKFGSSFLSNLNQSQLEAILASMSKIGCRHKSSVELIWGPPGTGKTTTLSILLYILLRMNVRTLVCAPVNIAIKELASRVTALVRNSAKTESEKSFSSCPLGDMLIFGNKDYLKVGSDIQDIFLDYRVKRLLDCKRCVASMLDFLENCVSQHRISVEKELYISKEHLHDEVQPSGSFLEFARDRFTQVASPLRKCLSTFFTNSPRSFIAEQNKSKEHLHDEVQPSGSKSFLEFARDGFTQIASPLRNCLSTFFTDLPRSFHDEKKNKSIGQLISLLENFEMLLFEDSSMTSDKLETAFLRPVMIGSESCVDTSSLMYVRSRCLSILRSLQASLSKFGLPIVADKKSTTEFCFQKASLVFCTISSSYKLHSVNMEPFHLLVIDEAVQVNECETITALQIPDVRHAILVGDELQLPATVISKLSEGAGFGRSLFERLSSMGHSKHLLNVQYRMHPSISRFPNSNFYLNKLLDAPNVQSQSYEKCYLQGKMYGPYSFINIWGGREELDDVGHSRKNMVEAAVIVKLVQKLFKAWNGSKGELSIGLISPYAAQVAAIQDKLQLGYENLERFKVKVKSVDGFQGGEEDIIIISTVRTHKGGSIGFLSSLQRTNVALTRARHCLWILGNERSLSRSHSVWEAIVSDAKDRQCFFNADEDRDLERTIIDVKKELGQLEDLLSGENISFKNSRWQVLFSDNFQKSFRKLKSSTIKKFVINLLLKLASGWRPKKINVDQKLENSSYIVKQFKVDMYYVVCSIDIIKDSIYKQVLKVWDILPMMETTKLLKRLDSIFSMQTDDFINRCNDKLFEGNLEVPRSWSCSGAIIRFKNPSNTKLSTGAGASSAECTAHVENSKVSESLLLMKFYALSTGTADHLLSDLEGREVDLPFDITDEQREITIFPRSSFILGRSGTGKTTILTMKLFQKFQQYCIASGDSVAADNSVHVSNKVDVNQYTGDSSATTLHQLFVTVSPKLCYAVKKYVSQLKSFATGKSFGSDHFTDMDDIDEMAEFKDIPDTFVGIQQEKYPLIITFHKFLMMLDGTIGNSYFQRFLDVTDPSHYEGTRSVVLQTFMRKNEVTYDRFWSLYWPHFNAKLTKNLDASRVFTEIMSHIKGGLQEGEVYDCKRSREDYISLSKNRVSTLNAEKRGMIYDIFENYEKMKMKRGEFDLADFVNDIHLRLKNEDLLGDKMDFVYIDEVQDLTMRQISLFRYICRNVDEGFVFSGDTAQTIARGIDFRFEDIRSLFYNEFVMKSRTCGFSGRRGKGLISDMFNLSQNFRTHTGVLGLAQSVIDLICHYFPQSIDSLAPETSRIYGEPPIVLEPGSDENLIISIFGHSGKDGGKWVGFGADQVIIVRDECARKEISSYIGHQALVLTIPESKGLEFQDVLLYNFFGSSLLSDQWRVVYEFLKEKDLLDGDSPKSFPSFSHSRHNILCSELKQLYVAITRTRQRLWICENNVELSRPMLDYWRRSCLVQVRKIDDSLVEAMQGVSSPEEWKSQGIRLFWEKNYEMATMCFGKAGEEMWEKRAKASRLRAAADSLRGSSSEEASMMLREAAEIFDSIDRFESAAECFSELGDYERAGRIYLEKCGMSELRKAGECFCLAGNYNIAAEVYAKGNFFKECLSACTKGNCFDLGLQYVEYWRQQASFNSVILARFEEIDKIAQKFLENCALKCYKAKDNASLMKFVRAFHSMESKRNFLKSLDCLEELLVLEEESGNFNEAAEIAKSLGDIIREVDLLEKGGKFANACLLILSYVLSNSVWVSGNQGWPLKSFPQKVELLNRAMSIAEKVSEAFHASICAEAKILLYEQGNLSELMQCYGASKQYKAPIGEILSIRKLLDAHFQVNPPNYEWDPELHVDPRSFNERISRNEVSGGTLVYLWNSWKVHSLKILECLSGLQRPEFIRFEGIVRFCFSYFGARLPDNFSATFHLLNPDAAWARNIDKQLVRRNKLVTLEAHHFASAARKYWHQELVSVGLRVLEALQELYKSSVEELLPKHCQSMCLLHISDIAKFFLESKSINMETVEVRKLKDSLELSTKYFEFVFPLDSRESLSENMILLRESELSKSLLEEIVSRNISRSGELSYGQIGRAVMIMLGTCKPKHALCDRIAKRLSKDTSWKSFIENLRVIMESDSPKESELSKSIDEGTVSEPSSILPITTFKEMSSSECVQESTLRCSQESLSQEFHKALEETYNVHWRAYDYISPSCFFYLVERLLIFVPHSQGFLFATKSSFMEYLICMPPAANPKASLVTDKNSYSTAIFNFVVRMVQECLLNSQATAEWIETSRIDGKYYFPVLMLRLLVILCISCLNSSFSSGVLFELLRAPQVRSQLPREFYKALRPRRPNDNLSVSAVAGAFKVIGDPLVVVALSENKPKFAYGDAISLDLTSFSCRNEIMKTMFPRSTEVSPTAIERNATKSGSVGILPAVSDEGRSTIMQPLEMTSKNDSNLSSETGEGHQQINWGLIRETSDAFESLRNGEDGKPTSLVLRKKVEIEELKNFLADTVAQLSNLRSHSGEDKDLLSDATSMIEQLNYLLENSDFDSKALSEIGELLKSFEARRPQLDTLVSLLTVENNPNGIAVAEESDDNKISDSSRDVEDRKTEDSVAAATNLTNEGAEYSQGKGKNEKSKKGKVGRSMPLWLGIISSSVLAVYLISQMRRSRSIRKSLQGGLI